VAVSFQFRFILIVVGVLLIFILIVILFFFVVVRVIPKNFFSRSSLDPKLLNKSLLVAFDILN
jgi:hypothetical protein